MGEDAILFKEKINYKEAGGSGGFDAHIDAKYVRNEHRSGIIR